MVNTASTLAIAKPAYLYFLLGFVEPKSNATFCGNQDIGVLGGNGIDLTSELIFHSFFKCSRLVVKPLRVND